MPVPAEFFYLELMIEWGVSYEVFIQTPQIVLDKIIQYRTAKSKGEKRYELKHKKR